MGQVLILQVLIQCISLTITVIFGNLDSIGSASVLYHTFWILLLFGSSSTIHICRALYRDKNWLHIRKTPMSMHRSPHVFGCSSLEKSINFGMCRLCSTLCHVHTYKIAPVLRIFSTFQFQCGDVVRPYLGGFKQMDGFLPVTKWNGNLWIYRRNPSSQNKYQ